MLIVTHSVTYFLVDQRLALPSDSYLVNYFNALDAFLDVGPPVYFVAKGVDVSTRPVQQAICGRFSTCEELSLANVLEAERKRPDSSFIAEPPYVEQLGQYDQLILTKEIFIALYGSTISSSG